MLRFIERWLYNSQCFNNIKVRIEFFIFLQKNSLYYTKVVLIFASSTSFIILNNKQIKYSYDLWVLKYKKSKIKNIKLSVMYTLCPPQKLAKKKLNASKKCSDWK